MMQREDTGKWCLLYSHFMNKAYSIYNATKGKAMSIISPMNCTMIATMANKSVAVFSMFFRVHL